MLLHLIIPRVLAVIVIQIMSSSDAAFMKQPKLSWPKGKSQWSSWSPCSATCGDGLQTRTRLLHPRMNSQRMRTKSEAKVCNMMDCGGTDWLEKSCSKLNGKSVAGSSYIWKPFYTGAEDCWVRCRAVGELFYARLAAAPNGTPCRPGAASAAASTSPLRNRHVCLSGHCTEVGCDGVVGSGQQFDKCGVCGGVDSTCRLVAGLLTTPALATGYNHLTTIPANATAISVSQLKTHSKNRLALRKQDGTFILNGNNVISPPGDYHALCTNFQYLNMNGKVERIKITGPTCETVDLMLIYKEPNSGIKYEYRLPAVAHKPLSASVKKHSSFVDGGGTGNYSLRDLSNVYYARQGKVSYAYEGEEIQKHSNEEHYRNKIKPKKRKYSWKLSGFSECSKSCGGGFENPIVVCVRGSTDSVVHDKRCASLDTPPLVPKACNIKPCPSSRWQVGRWGSCSVTCGHGSQFRKVTCISDDSQPSDVSSWPSTCQHLPQPPSKRPCSLPPCQPTPASQSQWIVTPWSQCSEECGKGVQKRRVACFGGQCDPSKKPEDQRPCVNERKCKGQWFTGPWHLCSGSCGMGVQLRTVVCVAQTHGKRVITHSENCPEEAPPTSQPCQLSPCTQSWFVTDWNECTKPCDSGVQKREVRCLSIDLQPSFACNETDRPSAYHVCNTTPCLQNDDDCIDKLHHCPTVVQARLCSYNYYNRFCCHSCRKRI